MSSYRWLLMDADNTLFDFNAAEEYAITRTLVHHGLPADGKVKACYKAANAAVWAAFRNINLVAERDSAIAPFAGL